MLSYFLAPFADLCYYSHKRKMDYLIERRWNKQKVKVA